jgi:CHAD domain-containing protein
VPAADGARSEVREPLVDGSDDVPGSLRRMVRAVTRGADLVPVARISTVRTERRLIDATGQVLVELADDQVEAERLQAPDAPDGSAPVASRWRELELELVGGDADLMAALDAGLRERGLRPAGVRSKVSQVLQVRAGEAGESALPGPTKRSPALEVVLAHVAEQVQQVRRQDLPVRLDAPDSIHRMRVACRRLRSALSTFEPLFLPDAVRPLREELRWLAAELGTARDAEVLRDRLQQAVSEEQHTAAGGVSPEQAAGVAEDASQQLDATYRAAHERVLAVLDEERYHQLLDALDAFVEDPPSTSRAGGSARDVLPRLVSNRYRRLRRLVDAAHEQPPGEEREELLHEHARRPSGPGTPRVGAVGLRSAGSGVRRSHGGRPGGPGRAPGLGRHAEPAPGPRGLDLLAGRSLHLRRLYALEEARGAHAEQRFDAAWARARRGSLRRWLR